MNQSAWTQYTDGRLKKEEPIKYNRDSIGIKKTITNGAKYLIVRNVDELKKLEYLKSFATNLVGHYKGILIFDLLNSAKNFSYEKEYIDTIFCNAEVVVNDNFSTSKKTYFSGNASTQSNEEVFDGKFSSKLDDNKKYGMTTIINDAKFEEGFTVNVWKKGNSESVIVASGPSESKFYVKSSKVIKKDTILGWEKLELDFVIPEIMENKQLKIYLYNPSSKIIYFDNFYIKRYKRENVELLKNK